MRKRLEPIIKDINISLHFIKLAHRISKTYLPIMVLQSIFKAALPFINIIMPKFIIDELTGAQRVDVLMQYVCIVALSNMVLNVINAYFETLINIKNDEMMYGIDQLIGTQIMEMPFEKIEDPHVLDLKEKALFPIRNQRAIYRLIQGSSTLINLVLTMLGLMAVIMMLNPVILLVIIAIVLLNTSLNKKLQAYMYEFYQLLIPINRQFGYYANLTADFSMAKDIRLYRFVPLIMKRIEQYNKESLTWFAKLYQTTGFYSGVSQINMQVQMLFVYGYMTYKVLVKSIGIGDFTMYINAATQFSQSLQQFGTTYVELSQMCRYLEQYLEFEKIESKVSIGENPIPVADSYVIEFKNVSFRYPRSDQDVLKNLNLTILCGEKLSVVGLNGAGKTTFIKLLTRLYEPTSGVITLNGVDIQTFDEAAYMKLMSVVFQDFKLLAFSVKENICFDTAHEVLDVDVLRVLGEAGMRADIEKLEKGIHTSIYKSFDEAGIEFSGGQAQKLAIARAKYKDAPIVVLDEPTAALDPIAEHDIYSHFNELIGEKTAIYISHRLSSCQFCDRIAVFDKGTIVQLGTHEDLIYQKGGLYETMYSAQAQYYV
ncbi:MAG TPA: ABC transporter ATP-binding protein [Firmicutes bacterium]|nr:ABC transporter ATP-binding protein [Bacillota bacterium]